MPLITIAMLVGVGLGTLVQDEKAAPRDGGGVVVLIGDALLEGDYAFGSIETALTAASGNRPILFRNLGWTGDTVKGEARAAFETAKEGFERRAALVSELKPTEIFVAYGMNESFGGVEGLEAFERDLRALLDSITEKTNARITLIAPIVHERLGSPLPDPGEHNAELERYRSVLRRVAEERTLGFVDLAAAGIGASENSSFPDTTDGIHLSQEGYRRAAAAVAKAIHPGLSIDWDVALDRSGKALQPTVGTTLSQIVGDGRAVRFVALDTSLPIPGLSARRLRVNGLEPGTYSLKIDGKERTRASHEEWSGNAGVRLESGPETEQAEALREAVRAKNTLLFHRLRPQNQTYLFGFRKHEQGQNAQEIPQFDPLVAEREAEIDRLKRPRPHTYELIRVEDANRDD